MHDALGVFLLELLQVSPESVQISSELCIELMARGACFFDDGIVSH
jgi:hypothetical protein